MSREIGEGPLLFRFFFVCVLSSREISFCVFFRWVKRKVQREERKASAGKKGVGRLSFFSSYVNRKGLLHALCFTKFKGHTTANERAFLFGPHLTLLRLYFVMISTDTVS